MDFKLLDESEILLSEAYKLERVAKRNLKRFIIDNVGIEKPLRLNEETFSIDTTEGGNDYEYVGYIQIARRWSDEYGFKHEEDYYEIEFVWDFEPDRATKSWKMLYSYDGSWDLGELIYAVKPAIKEDEE